MFGKKIKLYHCHCQKVARIIYKLATIGFKDIDVLVNAFWKLNESEFNYLMVVLQVAIVCHRANHFNCFFALDEKEQVIPGTYAHNYEDIRELEAQCQINKVKTQTNN